MTIYSVGVMTKPQAKERLSHRFARNTGARNDGWRNDDRGVFLRINDLNAHPQRILFLTTISC